MFNKYEVKKAKYEAMSDAIVYLETQITECEAELETAKKRLAEQCEDVYKQYYADRIEQFGVRAEAYKTVKDMFLQTFD